MNQCRHASSSKSNIVSIRMYRILLRQLQALPPQTPFLLQPALNPRDYGRAKLVSSLYFEENKDILKLFSRWLNTIPGGGVSSDDEGDEVYQELVGTDAVNNDDDDDHTNPELWSLVDGATDICAWTTREAVQRAVRAAFASDIATTVKQRHTYAFAASRFLRDVEGMLERSSVSTQDGLRVVATSRYEFCLVHIK